MVESIGHCQKIVGTDMQFTWNLENEQRTELYKDIQKRNVIDAQGEVLCLGRTSVNVHSNTWETKKRMVNKASVA